MTKTIHDLSLVDTKSFGESYVVQTFRAPSPLPVIAPGQFAEIATPGNSVFLRRPFSIFNLDAKENTISFLYKIIGRGTKAMAAARKGETMNMIYPLGKGFTLNHVHKTLLTGGGTGTAAMYLLAKALVAQGSRPVILLGGKTVADIIALDAFTAVAETLHTTEDGSSGFKGLITQHPLFGSLKEFDRIYSCGPEPMMRAIASLANKEGVDCEVSLENTMGCGIGVCLSCVTETTEGHKNVCTSGPVFNTRELKAWV